MKRKWSEILAEREDIEVDLDEDEAILDIVILCRNTNLSEGPGRATVGIYCDEHVDSILLAGIIESARQVGNQGWVRG